MEQSETRHGVLGDIFYHAVEGMFQSTPDGAFLSVNLAFGEMMGFASPEEMTSSIADLATQYYGTPQDRTRYREMLEKGGIVRNFEAEVRKKDGTFIWVRTNTRAVYKEDGSIDYYEGAVVDITAEKRAQEALIESETRYRALFENANDAIFLMSEDVFVDCNDRTLEMFGCTREQIVGQPPYGVSPPRQPDGRDSKEKALEKIQAVLRGEPQLFEWKHRRYDGKPFDAEVNLNEVRLGDKVFIQAVVRDITERKKTEEGLRDSEQHLSDILEYLPDATLVIDKAGKVLIWNRAMEEMTGVSAMDIVGKGDHEYAIPFYGEKRPILIDLALNPEDETIEKRYPLVKRDGGIFYTEIYIERFRQEGAWIWGKAKPLYDSSGNVVGAIETIRDVTSRKLAEEALRKAGEMTHYMLMRAPFGVFVVNQLGLIEYANEKMSTISGILLDEFKSINVFDLPGYRESGIADGIRSVFRGETFSMGPLEYTSYRGRKTTIRNFTGLPFQEEGISKALIFVEDVTERVLAERLVERERAALFSILQRSPYGVMHVDKQGNVVYINPMFSNITGYTIDDIPVAREWLNKAYPDPEYRRTVIGTWKGDMLKRGANREFVITCKDGATKEIEFRPTLLDDGSSITMLSDITERKMIENLLKESEERYRILTEKALVGVYLVQGGKFRYVNPAFARIHGYEPDELIDVIGPAGLIIPEDRETAEAYFRQRIKGEIESVHFETRMKRKDGAVRTVEVHGARAVFNGEPAVLGMLLDVTERKQYEEKLQIMSTVDELTGLYNRRGFMTLSDQQIRISNRTGRDLLLFFIDLDGMKWINDTLGHKEGDKALVEAAGVLRETFRESDIIGRMGGDEFAVLVLYTTDTSSELLQERLCLALDSCNSREKRPYQITFSTGTALYEPATPVTLDELMSKADTLMYEEKKRKRGR